MKFTATSLITVLVLLVGGMASNIPFGMSELGQFRGKNLSLIMPLSKHLTQIERLSLAEKCLPFRRKCRIAEQCCSQKCLVYIQRCNV